MLKKNIRSVKLIRTERGIQMKKDVFQNCPIYQSDRFEIRKMEMKDAHELFRCYSNPQVSIPWLQSHSIRYREPSIPNDRAT